MLSDLLKRARNQLVAVGIYDLSKKDMMFDSWVQAIYSRFTMHEYHSLLSMLGFLISTSPLRLLPLEFPANREFMIHVNSFWIILSRNTIWKQLIKSRFMKISLCDLLIYKLLHCSKHAWSIYISSSLVFSFIPSHNQARGDASDMA